MISAAGRAAESIAALRMTGNRAPFFPDTFRVHVFLSAANQTFPTPPMTTFNNHSPSQLFRAGAARVLILFCAMIAAAAAQNTGGGAIRGVVTNEATRAFIEGATVTSNTTPARTTVTDSRGVSSSAAFLRARTTVRVESAGSNASGFPSPIGAGATQPLSSRVEVRHRQPAARDGHGPGRGPGAEP